MTDYIDKVNLGGTTYDVKDSAAHAALDNKADIDGTYEQMTVGNADQLVATVGVEDKAPYNFRTAGGSADIGDRLVEKVVGGTVAWNQLAYLYTPAAVTVVESGDVLTLTPTNSGNRYRMLENANNGMTVIKNHVYIQSVVVKSDGEHDAGFQNYANPGNLNCINKTKSANWTTLSQVEKATVSGICYVQLMGSTSFDYQIKKNSFVLFDLTQMFGSTIADYIYSLETANAGAGVAWFRKLFPKPYYAYNAGELMSVQAARHKTVGFNALNIDRTAGTLSSASDNAVKRSFEFDKYYVGLSYNNYYDPTKITEAHVNNPVGEVGQTTTYNAYGVAFPIKVLPNTTYYCAVTTVKGTPNISVGYYDADGNPLSFKYDTSNGTFTTPANCHIAAVVVNGNTSGGIAVKDININLSWDGERDGEYEPYTLHEYPLDSSLTLRGIPKLDANNELYYDGDEYESDGTVTRKYGVVDLGTLDWIYSNPILYTSMQNYSPNPKYQGNLVCLPYINRMVSLTNPTDMSISVANSQEVPILRVADTRYTDAATFKTAMSGVYLVYELATPTTESADSYQNPQIVDDFGTEEYVDAGVTATTPTRDVAIPVGHVSQYQANLRAKLEMAPNSPDGDGDYIVRQTNGQNEYVPITFPADELPAAPTSNGTYTLKCTVSGSGTTYSWVSDA